MQKSSRCAESESVYKNYLVDRLDKSLVRHITSRIVETVRSDTESTISAEKLHDQLPRPHMSVSCSIGPATPAIGSAPADDERYKKKRLSDEPIAWLPTSLEDEALQ
jgi:hypothetical protein